MSAYGLSVADERKEVKVYLGLELKAGFNFEELLTFIKEAKPERSENEEWSEVIEEVTISYAGTSFSLTVALSENMLE